MRKTTSDKEMSGMGPESVYVEAGGDWIGMIDLKKTISLLLLFCCIISKIGRMFLVE